jgi:hypothetical protein
VLDQPDERDLRVGDVGPVVRREAAVQLEHETECRLVFGGLDPGLVRLTQLGAQIRVEQREEHV